MADTVELDKWVKQAKEAIDQLAHLASAREAYAKGLEAKLAAAPSEETIKKQIMEKLKAL
jgi:flagellar biosynthesis chaperone FliJ